MLTLFRFQCFSHYINEPDNVVSSQCVSVLELFKLWFIIKCFVRCSLYNIYFVKTTTTTITTKTTRIGWKPSFKCALKNTASSTSTFKTNANVFLFVFIYLRPSEYVVTCSIYWIQSKVNFQTKISARIDQANITSSSKE